MAENESKHQLKPVSLSEITDAMEFQSEEMAAYFHKPTGEIVTITEEMMWAAEADDPLEDHPEWMREGITIARDYLQNEEEYIGLPDQFDIHEYSIMERFCLDLEDREKGTELYYTIKGRGAFRRFKDKIHELGLDDEWYKCRDEAITEVAKYWCIENNLPYCEDID